MIGTRIEALVNQSVLLGFRHFYNGVLANAFAMYDIKILDPDTLAVVYVIPAAQIQNPETGVYQATIPANILNKRGQWRDVWEVESVDGSTHRFFTFQINVVVVPSQQATPSLESITSCTLDCLNACMIKQYYLWPVWSVLANGYYLSDSQLQHHIDTAISWAQRHVGLPFRQTRVRTRPFGDDTPNLVFGTDYDEEGELLQWNAMDAPHWSSIRLPHTSIIRVIGIRGIYGGKVVYRIPGDWVERNELAMGFVRIRPTTVGNIASLVDGNAQFLDTTLLESMGQNMVPGFWAIDYDYGMAGGQIPKEICSVIMKKASVILLDQIGQSIGKGVTSRTASVDGLSSSIGTVASAERTMFGALARRYEESLTPENLLDLRRYYKGMSVFIA